MTMSPITGGSYARFIQRFEREERDLTPLPTCGTNPRGACRKEYPVSDAAWKGLSWYFYFCALFRLML